MYFQRGGRKKKSKISWKEKQQHRDLSFQGEGSGEMMRGLSQRGLRPAADTVPALPHSVSRCTACKTMTEGGSQQFALYLCTTSSQPRRDTGPPIHHFFILSVDSLNKEVMVHASYQYLSYLLFVTNVHRQVYAHRNCKNKTAKLRQKNRKGGRMELN